MHWTESLGLLTGRTCYQTLQRDNISIAQVITLQKRVTHLRWDFHSNGVGMQQNMAYIWSKRCFSYSIWK